MEEVFDAMGQHEGFEDFVQLPEERQALPSHWVYKITRDGAGNMQLVKARLVCGGNHHIEGIDYTSRKISHSSGMAPSEWMGSIMAVRHIRDQ